jgi:NADH:ubiquinone oxidoreductase subunit 2 (subunit N)
MKTFALSAVAFAFPLLAFAQVRSIQEAGGIVTSIINGVLVPLVFAIAFIVFIWGVFQYFILGGSNQEKREEGQKLMLYGLIGFFLMVSVWGLVNILVGTFNLSQTPPNLPGAPGPR